jgi:hypothetical protein
LAASGIEIYCHCHCHWFSTTPNIAINFHAGHYTAWFKFSTLPQKQVRAFAASLIVKLGDWVTRLKT